MSKRLLKLVALTLSLVLVTCAIITPASAAYDAEQDLSAIYPELFSGELTADDTQYPTVILPGINHSPMYLANDDGTPYLNFEGKEVGGGLIMIDNTKIKDSVLKVVPSLLVSLFLRADLLGFSDKLNTAVSEILSVQQMDKTGVPVNNLGLESFDGPVSSMDEDTRNWFYRMLPMEPYAALAGEENIFLYTFALYGNPMDAADGLNAYIDSVLEQTGAEKVNLACVSLGGSILTGWLDTDDADYSKINRIVNIVSLLDGTEVVADFMNRDFNLADSFLYSDYIPQIMKESTGSATWGYVINIVLRLLPKRLVYSILTSAFSAVLDTVMLNDPQFWAMLGADDYDALAARYLSDGEHDVLKAKTDRYQTARLNRKSNLLEATAAGVEVFTISGYNLQYTDGEYNFFGIVKSSAETNSDAIINVSSSSLGATAAAAHTKLDTSAIADFDAKYLSPDGSLYAGTCLFPDRAFFFNEQHHEVGRDDVCIRLAVAIIVGQVDDIYTTDAFPQFNGNRNTRSLVRSDGGLLWNAEAFLGNYSPTIPAEKIAAVQAAYDAAVAMLSDTMANREAATQAYDNLYNALAGVGIVSAREEASGFSTFMEKMLKKFDDRLSDMLDK